MPNLKYITISHQKFLRELYFNGKKIIFLKQKTYKNYRSFEKAMQQLKNADIISVRTVENKNHFIKEYTLTINGIIFVEEIINDFIECNA